MWDYLVGGLLGADGRLREDLQPHVDAVAAAWVAAGILPDGVEIAAECLARLARSAADTEVQPQHALQALAWLELADPVGELIERAQGARPEALHLGALAVHLLDIAELMALLIYVPELPALFAKGDRTGNAARNVGLAQHLRG